MHTSSTLPVPATRQLPPGPKGLPLLGSMLEFRRDPLAFLRHTATYGPVSYCRILHYSVYLLNDPALIEQVLTQTNDRDFSKTPGDVISRALFGNGLLTSMGDSWLRQRRLLQPAFHRQRIAAYADIMTHHAAQMATAWQPGETREVLHDMMALTLEIVVQALFGANVAGKTKVVGEAFSTIVDVFAELMSNFALMVLFNLPLPPVVRFHRAVKQLDAIILDIIAQRRAAPATNEHNDLLAMLLNAQDEDGSRMSDKQVRDEVMTLFLAGHETTALALTWTWYLLAQNPQAERQLHQELDTVLAGRTPTLADLPNLKYTENIIKEAMRLYPPAWGVDGRMTLHDTTVGGWHLPKGTMVMMSQWVTHHDARFFPEPEQFRPERWTEEFTKQLPKYAYFPFGGGPRLCIGFQFAQMEAVLLLATLAQRYRLTLLPGQTITIQPSITLRPKEGIRVQVQNRVISKQ